MGATETQHRSFREAYSGWYSGLVTWADYEAVMDAVARAPDGWFVYDTREAPPAVPEPAERLAARLQAIDEFLRDNHRADYCGFVYVDDRAAPSMVKVYNPRNASACGSAEAPVPLFMLSRMPPETLPLAGDTAPKPGLLARLFRGET